jgi:dolichol-phosphate mannosyltransferase
VRVLVVLPTYNEAENVCGIIERVREVLPKADILVVDDNSPDQTAELAEKMGERLGHVEVLRRPVKAGLGSAYRDGFRWGLARGYDAFVEMDSDFSHDASDLPALLAPLSDGFDVVIGSRYVPGGSIPDWSVLRRFISRAGNLYADWMLGLGVKDSTAGFRAYRASLLSDIDLSSVRAGSYGFQVEMTYLALRAGARIREVPIRFIDRTLGKSKMSSATVVEAFLLVSRFALRRLSDGAGRRSRQSRESPGATSRVA